MSYLSVVPFCLALLMSWTNALHLQPWRAFHSDMFAAAAALLLFSNRAAIHAAAQRITAASWFFLTLAAIPLVQAMFGLVIFFGDALMASAYLLVCAWTVHWSARRVECDGDSLIVALAATLLAGALFSALVAMQQRVGLDPIPWFPDTLRLQPGEAPSANLGQRNQLATLLALGMVSAAYLGSRGWARPWSLAAAIGILVLAMSATQSRTPFMFFLVGLVVCAVLRRIAWLRQALPVVALCFAAWAALFYAWPTFLEALGLSDFETLAVRMQPGPRIDTWVQLIDAISRAPVVGYGWTQVSVALMNVAADHPNVLQVDHSHNIVVDLLIWNGVPIGGTIVGLAVWWMVRRVKAALSARDGFCILTVGVICTHAMLEYPLSYLYILMPFCVCIGALSRPASSHVLPGKSAPERKRSMRLTRAGSFVALAAMCGGMTYIAADYLREEQALRDLRMTGYRSERFEQPNPAFPVVLTQLQAYRRLAAMQLTAHMSEDDLEIARKVSLRYPFAGMLFKHAMAEALNGHFDAARRAFLELRSLHAEQYGPAVRSFSATVDTSQTELASFVRTLPR